MKKGIVAAVILAVLGIGVWCLVSFLQDGGSIDYFDLVDLEGKKINVTALDTAKPQLIFIFPRPCAPCSGNVLFWSQAAKFIKDDADYFGIVLDGATQAFEVSRKKNLRFTLYLPENTDLFLKKLGIQDEAARTIVYYKNKIVKKYTGDLDGDTFTELVTYTRDLNRRKP